MVLDGGFQADTWYRSGRFDYIRENYGQAARQFGIEGRQRNQLVRKWKIDGYLNDLPNKDCTAALMISVITNILCLSKRKSFKLM